MKNRGVGAHFDEVAAEYDVWKQKAHRYYSAVKRSVAEVIPPGMSVIEIGCGTGDILAHVKPSIGVGTDISSEMVKIARHKHPQLRFEVHDITTGPLDEHFDYVLSVDVAEHVDDLTAAFAAMAEMLNPSGTVIMLTANPKWAKALHAAERLRLKMPEGDHHWRSRDDLVEAAERAGLALVRFERDFLVPKAIPILEKLDSTRWAAPARAKYGLIQRAVFRAGT